MWSVPSGRKEALATWGMNMGSQVTALAWHPREHLISAASGERGAPLSR